METHIKIFQHGDDCVDWYAAETLEEARAEAATLDGDSGDAEDWKELADADLDRLIYADDDDAGTRSFRYQLQRLIDSGERFPRFFATTEY